MVSKQQRRPLRTSLPFGLAALQTDTAFMANRDDLGFGLDECTRKRKVAQARREGKDIGGKAYSPQLSDWYGSRQEVIEKARAKGYGVEGSINASAPEKPPEEPKPYEVDPKIVQREANDQIEQEKLDLTPKEHGELVEQTRVRLRGTQDD